MGRRKKNTAVKFGDALTIAEGLCIQRIDEKKNQIRASIYSIGSH